LLTRAPISAICWIMKLSEACELRGMCHGLCGALLFYGLLRDYACAWEDSFFCLLFMLISRLLLSRIFTDTCVTLRDPDASATTFTGCEAAAASHTCTPLAFSGTQVGTYGHHTSINAFLPSESLCALRSAVMTTPFVHLILRVKFKYRGGRGIRALLTNNIYSFLQNTTTIHVQRIGHFHSSTRYLLTRNPTATLVQKIFLSFPFNGSIARSHNHV
jgi:hypothetical protein